MDCTCAHIGTYCNACNDLIIVSSYTKIWCIHPQHNNKNTVSASLSQPHTPFFFHIHTDRPTLTLNHTQPLSHSPSCSVELQVRIGWKRERERDRERQREWREKHGISWGEASCGSLRTRVLHLPIGAWEESEPTRAAYFTHLNSRLYLGQWGTVHSEVHRPGLFLAHAHSIPTPGCRLHGVHLTWGFVLQPLWASKALALTLIPWSLSRDCWYRIMVLT